MVEVTYSREYLPHNYIGYHLSATGHAEYEPGNDIVCASVSALFYTLANYLEYIGAEDLEGSDEEKDFHIDCKALFHDKAVHTSFRMMVFGLQLLAEQYPDNVSVNIIED